MMTRPQRIEYEILDCTINGKGGGDAYTTTCPVFLERLGLLFPSIERSEFAAACDHLFQEGALNLRKWTDDAFNDCLGDATAFFPTAPNGRFQFRNTPLSQQYFRYLWALISPPAGFKGWTGPKY